MPLPVRDIGSAEENIAHAATVIGRSADRRKVFDAIYTGRKKIKTASEIALRIGIPRKRVVEEGKKLRDRELVKPAKVGGEIAYEKIPFFYTYKRKILGLVDSPQKLAVFPTKRNPAGTTRIVQLAISDKRAQFKQITIDDISSFSRVQKVKRSVSDLGNELSESAFKQGLQKILGEKGKFKDWGGETADIYTTRIRIGGRRRPVAIALKGPGTTGKLTPGKMGKNGDQIQRLFEAPADVFLVQYCRQIDLSVVKQMKVFAIYVSTFTRSKVLFGIIDGVDSRRIVTAYAKSFRPKGSKK